MLKNKCSVWKRIKFPTFWYNYYYFTWSDTYFIQLETLLINHPSYLKCPTLSKNVSHVLYFWWFPGVWILCADVWEHSVSSIFIAGVSRISCLHIKFRSRGITQKKEYNFEKKAKVWNKIFLPIFMLWCCPVFCSQYINM